jgi:hypothetical protein
MLLDRWQTSTSTSSSLASSWRKSSQRSTTIPRLDALASVDEVTWCAITTTKTTASRTVSSLHVKYALEKNAQAGVYEKCESTLKSSQFFTHVWPSLPVWCANNLCLELFFHAQMCTCVYVSPHPMDNTLVLHAFYRVFMPDLRCGFIHMSPHCACMFGLRVFLHRHLLLFS